MVIRAILHSALATAIFLLAYGDLVRADDNIISQFKSSQSAVLPSNIPVQLSADKLSFKYETNTYTAKGNVSLAQGNVRLRADEIVYNTEKGELTAQGRIIVRVGADVLEAEKIQLKLPDATGVIYKGKLLLRRHNIYLEGEKLEKTGENSYSVEDGSFTTCNGAIPDWRIRGKNIDVTLEGYGRLRHGMFYIRDKPVFYVPWLIYPAKRQRRTGFLMPTVASSSLKGLDIRFPLFLNFSASSDATIVPRVCSNRALQAGMEFRYFPYEDFQGRLFGEYTYDWKYGTEENPKRHRFYVTWKHDQDFDGRLRLKAEGTWVSDRDYFEFWGGRLDKRLRIRYLESNAVAYKQFDNFLFFSEARHFDNLDVPNNAVTVQTIPIVTGTMFNRQVPYTPFYLSSTINYNYFFAPLKHKQWLGSRLRADTRLSLPLALGRFLKLQPSMTYFAKAYAADYFENDVSIHSVNAVRTDLYQLNADAYTDFSAMYGGGLLGFQGIKHNFRPRVACVYRPFTTRETYPFFDETDRLNRIAALTAELRQTLTGKLGPGEYLDFLTLSLVQGYEFDLGQDELPNRRDTANVGWQATSAELTLKPHTLVDLSAQAEFDPVQARARRYSFNLGLMDHRGDLLRVVHQFTEDARKEDLNRQTNVNLQVKLGSYLDGFLETQYSHQFNFAYFTSIGINFHPQCWNILLRYSESREQDHATGRQKETDQTVFMTLSMYGLGQIYRFSRDWGELMGAAADSRVFEKH